MQHVFFGYVAGYCPGMRVTLVALPTNVDAWRRVVSFFGVEQGIVVSRFSRALAKRLAVFKMQT